MNVDQINNEIVFLKSEIASLLSQLQTTVEGSSKEFFLQQQILANKNQITEYVKLLQSTG
jgi:uncharacterized protein YukE